MLLQILPRPESCQTITAITERLHLFYEFSALELFVPPRFVSKRYGFCVCVCAKHCLRLKVAQILTGVKKNDAQDVEAVHQAVRTELSLLLFCRPGLWLDRGAEKKQCLLWDSLENVLFPGAVCYELNCRPVCERQGFLSSPAQSR